MQYSQHHIEEYLRLYFDKPGFFLEIGCWDGELISQTAWLERECNWSGVCVDPFPRNFENRKCQVIDRAVSADGRLRRFMRVETDRRDNGDVSYFSGFADAVRIHRKIIDEFCRSTELYIETITFDQLARLCDLPKYIDFLSIDTEGSELEIMQSIDFGIFTFGMIVFEHNEDSEAQSDIGRILRWNGYHRIASLRCDDIYITNDNGLKLR